MSKWRIWVDEFWGIDWNDRREISSPEFGGTEIDDDKIEETLLGYFKEEFWEQIEITADDDFVFARITVDDEEAEEGYRLEGMHAEKVS